MTTQQVFADRFEDFLQELMTRMGMTCTRNPRLPNRKTPDFLVKHEGRACYVEATHIEWPREFREKKGEENLRALLDEKAPEGWSITLAYPNDEPQRLTERVGKRELGLGEIVKWLSGIGHNPGTDERNREFSIKGIRIEVEIYLTPSVRENRVGWRKSYSKGGLLSEQHEGVRNALRSKYDKYTPEPDSLRDIPLIVALFDAMRGKREMGEALYGTRIPFITRSKETGEVLRHGLNEILNGVWLNSRGGELENRHNHLAGVWHFRSMSDSSRSPLLFANPYRQDIESIIPRPMLKQRVSELSHVDP